MARFNHTCHLNPTGKKGYMNELILTETEKI